MRKPHILLLVSDQQRPDLLGCGGCLPVRTPHLDALAGQGMLFNRAYTPCPLCTPARATLITGQYPSRHGAWSIGTDLREDCLSLPALLREQAGYRTAIVGKSHLLSCHRPGSPEAPPRSQEWEHWRNWSGPWFGFETARICVGHVSQPHAYSMHYGLWLRDQGIDPVPPYFFPNANQQVGRWELPEKYHQSRWVADESISLLRQWKQEDSDRPFFLSVNFPDPHMPFLVPAPWAELHDGARFPALRRRAGEERSKPTVYGATLAGQVESLGWSGPEGTSLPCQFSKQTTQVGMTEEEERIWRVYCGMQSLLDHHAGRILDVLRELNCEEETLVVYTSDHGDAMGEHWLWSKGASHYDPVVRVPMIARWPGKIPAGVRTDALQSLVDLPVSFLSAAGVPVPAEMQGRDQLPAWTSPERKVRNGVLIDHRVEAGLYVNSWITDRYRLSVHSILAEERDEVELYDFQEDPCEFENLACSGGRDAILPELQAQLLRYRMEISGPAAPRPVFA